LLELIERMLATASGTGIAPESSSTVNAEALSVSHDIQSDVSARGQPTQKDAEVSRENRGRTLRLLFDAKRAAESITDECRKAWALADIARALASTDADRAARVIADAERIVQSITNELWKAEALAQVARTWRPATRTAPNASLMQYYVAIAAAAVSSWTLRRNSACSLQFVLGCSRGCGGRARRVITGDLPELPASGRRALCASAAARTS
jgi:hypothetical protein